jgi:alkylhydroperoxidase family enzyme
MTNLSSDDTKKTDDVLASLLQKDAVPMATLHERYGSLLKLVRILIGVVPNCDPYLEIWPPAFRTYNIMVPNLLNLPFSLFGIGGAPKEIVGIGMYVSSRAAECSYCSAHTASFSLRRGVSTEKVAQALVGGKAFTPGELATIAVARSLARIPSELVKAECQALENCFTPVEAEWIVLGIAMMGFLNKFMDAVGVELESSTVAEVTSTIGSGAGWSPGKAGRDLDPAVKNTAPPAADSFWTKLSSLRFAPTALRLDKQWQQGVPDTWPAVGKFLRNYTGHDFPWLSWMHNPRAIKAVASILRENLNPATTVIGLEIKALAGIVFATMVADKQLAADVRVLGIRAGLLDVQLDEAEQFAMNLDAEPTATEPKVRAALLLARAASPSPAAITTHVVDACRQSDLAAAAVVELMAWISVLQMIHRLSSYINTDRR